ncbi:flagellar filament outer layer protein FlaA [Spirochaeta thermophila]|uniref:Flagellar filament outer layer protein n=1 Tax=Winmispira thermophila (strain ATCC 49972 / DSM 6192 / RI 19.B1) TaxID=665571 RepID=E0RSC6_WINT6|nr:flagellar filament outer layer protein FlaA [Spirochaeta thermophila]ADN01913.1 flagellar filament outer layer protein [Spirochaeta thermophila DSM 6192]
MKRIFMLLAMSLLVLGSLQVLAEEAVLIDFSTLTPDYPADNPTENSATLVDYSVSAGAGFSEEDKALMKTSLAINNWEVHLNSSARFVVTEVNSYVREARVKDTAPKYAGETVMGVRVAFPDTPYNAWAIVQPPFEIPAYADKTVVNPDGTLSVPQEEVGKGTKFHGYGVVTNVGVLKSVHVNVRGLNFPQGLSLILQDQNGEQQEIFLGYLNFDGWKELVWENPNYIEDVRKRELKTYPLYPNLRPLVKLIGFRIYKDGSMAGGDFITYIKDVRVVYDKAVLDLEEDIDHEAIWGILQSREEARRNAELRRLGNLQVLRYLERKKMHAEAGTEAGAETQTQ